MSECLTDRYAGIAKPRPYTIRYRRFHSVEMLIGLECFRNLLVMASAYWFHSAITPLNTKGFGYEMKKRKMT